MTPFLWGICHLIRSVFVAIGRSQLEPFKLALVKTELELCVGRRLLSRV